MAKGKAGSTSLILSSSELALLGGHPRQTSNTLTTIEERLDTLYKMYGNLINSTSTVVLFHNLWGYGTPEIPLTYKQTGINPALFGALQPVTWNSNTQDPRDSDNVNYRPPPLDLNLTGIVMPQELTIIDAAGKTLVYRENALNSYLLEIVQNILQNGARLKSGFIIDRELAKTLDVKSSPYHPREVYGVVVPGSTYFKINKTPSWRNLSAEQQKQATALFLPPLPIPRRR